MKNLQYIFSNLWFILPRVWNVILVVIVISSMQVTGAELLDQGGSGTALLEGSDAHTIMLVITGSDTNPYAQLVRTGIEAYLRDFFKKPINLVVVYLEKDRFFSSTYDNHLKALVLEKIALSHPDVYITLDWSAYNLIHQIQKETGIHHPVITTKIQADTNRSYDLYLPPQPAYNIVNTTRLALSLFPDTHTLVLIGGSTPDEIADLALSQESLARAKVPVTIKTLTNLSVPELKSHVANLPDDTLIFFLRYAQDPFGISQQSVRVLREISNETAAPIFCGMDTFVGDGAIGGLVINNEKRGRIMADAALRMLNGTPVGQIQISPDSYSEYQFDYRELVKYGIDSSQLVEGSHILYREESFWEKYFWIIIGISSLILIETLLIALLLLNRKHRISAELQLRESEERYRLLIEKAPDAIIVYDWDKNQFVDANPAAVRLLGCSREQLLTMNYNSFYMKDQPDGVDLATSVQTNLSQVFNGEDLEFERYIRTCENKELCCEVRLVNLHSKGNRLIRASFSDITARKQAEADLIRLHAELENRVLERTRELHATQEAFRQANIKLNLLSGITRHDIINQITGLLGYLEISLDATPDGPVHTYLEASLGLTQTIQSHIEFTRLYEDVGTQAPVWQRLAMIIDRVHLQFSHSPILWHLDVDPVNIQADPMIEKVFYTLVENTIRHGERVTNIRFSTTIQGPDLLIIYEDNGVGIDQADKGRVFDRLFGKHTGYGLFISQQILAITGMTIRETGTPGSGVRFEIMVPEGRWQESIDPLPGGDEDAGPLM